MSIEKLSDRPSDLQQIINAEATLASIEHQGIAHVDSVAREIDPTKNDSLAQAVSQEHQLAQIPFGRRKLHERRRNSRTVSRLKPH